MEKPGNKSMKSSKRMNKEKKTEQMNFSDNFT
jgi:hypothetical protein